MRLWRLLVAHFFAELDANVTQTLGILAVPGAFFVLVFQPLGFHGWDLVGVRYLFVSFSMVVMAMVVVVKWDALFPDRADYLILTPLPLRLWTVFAAKAAALAILLALFLADVNFFSTLMWPGIDGGKGALSIYGAHFAATAVGGIFAVLSILTLQGLLLAVCSGRVLQRATVLLQTLLMTVLVMLLFLSPLIGMQLPDLTRHPSAALWWFPGYWFVGFYERLRPATGNAALLDLGRIAMRGMAGVTALFVITYLAGYRRHARRVLESPVLSPSAEWGRKFGAAVNRYLLRNSMERAVFHFIDQTIVRSPRHRLFLSVYAGFGAALAVWSYGGERIGLLRLPLTLSFVLVSGLRAAFNFPSELRANWIFQSSEQPAGGASASAATKWVAVRGIVPLFLLFVPMEFRCFQPVQALFHLAFGVGLSLLLTEILFLGFHKVPFTCSYLAGKVNLVGLGVVYLLGFTMYSSTMAGFEEWLENRPAAAAAFVAVLAASWALLEYRPRWEGALEFEDDGEPDVRTLEIEA
jgi:hypothetical protein